MTIPEVGPRGPASPSVALRPCSRFCVHATRSRVLIAQLAHLTHKVSSVAHGLHSGELTPQLATAILSRALSETAAMCREDGS